MPTVAAEIPTLTIDELAALAADIQPLTSTEQNGDTATAQHLEAICARYGLTFTDASTQESPCR
ncbi:hypothetical protein [Actinoplanes sp. NPDC049316]|uniref:hypothetical protein n=1 Tax=Actinoplanes sp. NPDC049316 TaxID=3154727 RepID=UPI00341F7E09